VISIVPPARTVEWAKAKDAAWKQKYGAGLFDAKDGAWHGYLGELVVAAWARSRGCRAKINGGFDSKPDVEINGFGFGVKTVSLKRDLVHRIYAIVPDEHLGKEWDYWIFLAVIKEEPHETYILGATTPAFFRENATAANWQHPCHYITAQSGLLTTPGDLLAQLSG
jgi:hypothetical protein